MKFGTLTDGAKIGLSALDKYVAGDVIATGITAANNEFLVLDETNWNYNINTGTQEITLVAKASN